MLGVKPTLINVECRECGHKQRLERRISPGELSRFVICHGCEAELKVDLTKWSNA